MLQDRGARSVLSIEANARAFLKCLCIKELFHLDRVKFELGDFMPFLASTGSKYDLVLASGVLYHMQKPVELIRLIAGVSTRALFWTHYFDEALIRSRPDLATRFGPLQILDDQYEYSSQLYLDEPMSPAFCGGPEQASKWLTRESILRALWQSGFRRTEIAFEDPSHPNGPAFAICATK
jgi:hypothetical protein